MARYSVAKSAVCLQKRYLAPEMQILPGEPLLKTCILPPGMRFLLVDPSQNAIGLVLSSNWAGFVVKTWQPLHVTCGNV